MGKHTTGHSPGSGLRPENFLRSAAGLHVPEGFSPELMRDTDTQQTCPQENLQDYCLHEDRGSSFSSWESLINSWSRTWPRNDTSWTFVPFLSATHGFSTDRWSVSQHRGHVLLLVQMDGHITRAQMLVSTVSLFTIVSDSFVLRAVGSLSSLSPGFF